MQRFDLSEGIPPRDCGVSLFDTGVYVCVILCALWGEVIHYQGM